MTIAFRVPTFAKRLRHARRGRRTATISSSSRSDVLARGHQQLADRHPAGLRSRPATSTSASWTSSAGRLSPAGLAVARLPPSVARARICGEPTVTTAPARAAKSARRSAMSAIGCAAPIRIQRSSRSMPWSSGTAVRSSTPARSVRPKFTSTMRSVPPAIGWSSGRPARTSTASQRVVGRMAPPHAPPKGTCTSARRSGVVDGPAAVQVALHHIRRFFTPYSMHHLEHRAARGSGTTRRRRVPRRTRAIRRPRGWPRIQGA